MALEMWKIKSRKTDESNGIFCDSMASLWALVSILMSVLFVTLKFLTRELPRY